VSEQRTVPHLEWELRQAELEHGRMLVRIDILLNRNAHLQIENRALRRQVTSPGQGPEAQPGK
jgi:regulator of replication initiation timing